jgi:hypothetical protein
LKIIKGYYRPSRHGPKPSKNDGWGALPADPPPQLQLNEVETKHWREALAEAAWLRASDAYLLGVWCALAERLTVARETRRQTEIEGNAEAAAIYTKLIDRLGESLLQTARQLGFSPAARTRLGVH